MPATLSEMNHLTIISPSNVLDGNPRFSNPPPVQQSYQNWTPIEDVMSCQTALPQGTYDGTYMLPGYNSNGVIPAYHQAVCPSNAQQASMNIQNDAMYSSLPQNIYTSQYQPNYVPAAGPYQSFQSTSDLYNAYHPQYQTNYVYPPFAGAVPGLKNAAKTDSSIAIEGYAPPAGTSAQCLECVKHVGECNLCNKLTQCSNTKFWVVIVILVIIILILLGYIFITKSNSRKIVANPSFANYYY